MTGLKVQGSKVPIEDLGGKCTVGRNQEKYFF